MSWSDISLWLGFAGAAAMMAIGWRWAFRPQQVVATPGSGASDPHTVRWFGFVVMALGALVLLLKLYDLFSE